MKSIQIILILCITGFHQMAIAQQDLSQYKDLTGVYITSYWGDIYVNTEQSNKSQAFDLKANYTDSSKQTVAIDKLSEYINMERINNKLYISTRKPEGFESIDLILNLPKHLLLEIELLNGGNIFAQNLDQGIEINSLNGSVKLEQIGKYALVNAANGEINASFKTLNANYPISLVTMNGGVTISIPKSSERDLRLISRKNGYVESDFRLQSDKKIINLNVKSYSKQPIINTATINGGGALMFLSTENGPIAIKKLAS